VIAHLARLITDFGIASGSTGTRVVVVGVGNDGNGDRDLELREARTLAGIAMSTMGANASALASAIADPTAEFGGAFVWSRRAGVTVKVRASIA
jgi:hypothetical protein